MRGAIEPKLFQCQRHARATIGMPTPGTCDETYCNSGRERASERARTFRRGQYRQHHCHRNEYEAGAQSSLMSLAAAKGWPLGQNPSLIASPQR